VQRSISPITRRRLHGDERTGEPVGAEEGTAARLRDVRQTIHDPAGDHDWVIDEAPVALVYNGVSHVVMMATPTALEEFAVGFSPSGGLLQCVDQPPDVPCGPREVGTNGRKGIEALLGARIYLDLHVKVAKDWQRDPKQLVKLGF